MLSIKIPCKNRLLFYNVKQSQSVCKSFHLIAPGVSRCIIVAFYTMTSPCSLAFVNGKSLQLSQLTGKNTPLLLGSDCEQFAVYLVYALSIYLLCNSLKIIMNFTSNSSDCEPPAKNGKKFHAVTLN